MFDGLIKTLLFTKQLHFGHGNIMLKDIPLNIDSAYFISTLTDYFIKSNNLTDFYFLSWLFGFTLVKKFSMDFKLKTPDEIYRLGMELASAMGSGLYKTHSYDWNRYTSFEINSPYVRFFDKSEHSEPVCWYIAGAMGGGGSLVHNEPCQCIETECMITGAPRCKFLIGTEKELKQRGLWGELAKKVDLDKIYPLQKKIYKEYSDSKDPEFTEGIIDLLVRSKHH